MHIECVTKLTNLAIFIFVKEIKGFLYCAIFSEKHFTALFREVVLEKKKIFI